MSDYTRTLAMLRRLEATSTAEDRRTYARDLRIGEDWPPTERAEAEAILGRFRAEGVAPPSWGHAANVLRHLKQ